MAAQPPDGGWTDWFRWGVSLAVAILGSAFLWLQRQIGQVKRDADMADDQLRTEALDAIRTLRTELTQRHDEERAERNRQYGEERTERNRQYGEERTERARQHKENVGRIDRTDDAIRRMDDAATVQRQRFFDYLNEIKDQQAKMATRDEIRVMIGEQGRRDQK